MRTNRLSSLGFELLMVSVIGVAAVLIGACGGPAASGTSGQPASPSTSTTTVGRASP
jgi:hypothetical protein